MDNRKWFIVMVVLTIACAFVVAPVGKKPGFLKNLKITPGIDIAGGADLTFRILYSSEGEKREERKRPQAIIDVLRKRINQRGLKEPRLTTLDDDKVVIQIAVQSQEELDSYKEILKKVGKLELREVASQQVHESWRQNPGYKDDPHGTAPAGYAAIENDRKDLSRPWLADDYLLVKFDPSDKETQGAVISGADLKNASFSQTLGGGRGGWKVDFTLTDEGGKKFDGAAKTLFNQDPKGLIAIIMDGKIISKPQVNSERFGGSGEISGDFSKSEAENLAVVLRSGQLPVAIGTFGTDGKPKPGEPESESFIGPTLAQDSLNRGIAAAVCGAIFVFGFMIVYYRAGGVIAVFSLICNIVYLLTIMAIFGATMTLPGLAGLALTVAMSVDANILILERIREEMNKGKTAMQAYESGHARAFSAILDGNLTTLIAAVVLYYFGTDAVQGFATVLAIGIATTMFSVLVVGKMLTRLLVQAGSIREFKMMRMWEKINVNFVKGFAICFIVSILAVGASIAIFSMRVNESLGMDFKGGVRVIFKLNKDTSIEDVRKRLDSLVGPDGRQLYPDIEVSAMGHAASSATKIQLFASTMSDSFQVRSSTQDLIGLQRRIQEAFRDLMSHVPMDPLVLKEDREVVFYVKGSEGAVPVPSGGYLDLYFKSENFNESEVSSKLESLGRAIVSEDAEAGSNKPNLKVQRIPQAPAGLVQMRVHFAKPDLEEDPGKEPEKYVKYRDAVKRTAERGEFQLSDNPFTAPGRIGPTAASELKDSTILALLVSWVLMIIYIAVRFTSWKFGVASVVALVHNAIVTVGIVALAGWVVPKSLGLSFEMNVTTLAAILTIIGYSINDTVVIFDRIRENLVLLKKETLKEVMNVSVNQTMSRTILTGLSTIVTVALLYVFTMTSAGGVAEFAFPMFFGLIVGTYATIYVACPVALWLFRGQRPVVQK